MPSKDATEAMLESAQETPLEVFRGLGQARSNLRELDALSAAERFPEQAGLARVTIQLCEFLRVEHAQHEELLYTLVHSYQFLGRARRELLQLPQALEAFERAVPVSELLETVSVAGYYHPDHECDLQDDLAELLYYQNRLAEAARTLARSIPQREALGQGGTRSPGGNQRKAALAWCLLGDIQRAQGEDPLPAYQTALKHAQANNCHGHNARMLRLVAKLLERDGDLHATRGEYEPACAQWQLALEILLEQYGQVPRHTKEAQLLGLGLGARLTAERVRTQPDAAVLEDFFAPIADFSPNIRLSAHSPSQLIDYAAVFLRVADLAEQGPSSSSSEWRARAAGLLQPFADFLRCPPLRELVQRATESGVGSRCQPTR